MTGEYLFTHLQVGFITHLKSGLKRHALSGALVNTYCELYFRSIRLLPLCYFEIIALAQIWSNIEITQWGLTGSS